MVWYLSLHGYTPALVVSHVTTSSLMMSLSLLSIGRRNPDDFPSLEVDMGCELVRERIASSNLDEAKGKRGKPSKDR